MYFYPDFQHPNNQRYSLQSCCGTYLNKPGAPGIKRLLLSLFLLAILWPAGYGQQPSDLSLYMYNNMYFNPGFAGSSGGIAANALMREQYIGFKDDEGNRLAPRLIFVTLDSPIRKIHGGVGGSILSDQIGFFNNIQVNLGYAFRQELGPGTLGIGVQLQIDNIKIDFDKYKEHVIDDFDPVITEGEQSDLLLDCNAGIYYEVPEKFYVGLSAIQLVQPKGKNTWYQHRRTYSLSGGYNFTVPGHPLWAIQPSAIIYYDGGAFQWNLSAILAYKKKYWGGLGYRFQESAIIMGGVEIKNFRIGLAYDVNTTGLNPYNGGSVEVMLGYTFKMELEKYRKRYKNTRFL